MPLFTNVFASRLGDSGFVTGMLLARFPQEYLKEQVSFAFSLLL